MLPKHSKDIVFIVIILLLIGVIWGVPKAFWLLISVNVIVILVGILYVKLNGAIENNDIKITDTEKQIYEVLNENKNEEDTYKKLIDIAGEEVEEVLEEANYDNFDNVKNGRAIARKFIDGEISLTEAQREINKVCKFKLQAYYLGLALITVADVDRMDEMDYDYIALGVKIIKSLKLEHDTELVKFLRNTKLKIDD